MVLGAGFGLASAYQQRSEPSTMPGGQPSFGYFDTGSTTYAALSDLRLLDAACNLRTPSIDVLYQSEPGHSGYAVRMCPSRVFCHVLEATSLGMLAANLLLSRTIDIKLSAPKSYSVPTTFMTTQTTRRVCKAS
jgi:hypothetical protein